MSRGWGGCHLRKGEGEGVNALSLPQIEMVSVAERMFHSGENGQERDETTVTEGGGMEHRKGPS